MRGWQLCPRRCVVFAAKQLMLILLVRKIYFDSLYVFIYKYRQEKEEAFERSVM